VLLKKKLEKVNPLRGGTHHGFGGHSGAEGTVPLEVIPVRGGTGRGFGDWEDLGFVGQELIPGRGEMQRAFGKKYLTVAEARVFSYNKR